MKRLKTAMVGLNWGHAVIKDHLLPGGTGAKFFELDALCSQERDKVDALAAEYGVRAFYDYDALLADPAIEAICLMTGPAGRAALIRKAVDAGKHVLTTKPIELDPEAALDVLRHARRVGRVVHLNSPTPLPSSDVAQIQSWREELALGRPVAARADIWASYREEEDGRWYDDPELCPVAPIFRLGIYLINDLVRLFGKPTAVSVMSSRLFTGRPTPDNAQLSILFENGSLANVFASFCVDDAQWWLSSLTLNYEKGTIYRNVRPEASACPRFQPELQVVTNDGNGTPVFRHAIAGASTEDYQWENFYHAIVHGRDPAELSPEATVYAVRVIRAMAVAAKSGKTEPVLCPDEAGSGIPTAPVGRDAAPAQSA